MWEGGGGRYQKITLYIQGCGLPVVMEDGQLGQVEQYNQIMVT